jgi:hypothetical protein
MEPWYKVTTPRIEVRERRSFNPDEFAIALEQVVAGNAPLDYRDPRLFFDRTVFTRALNEHLGLVLRRLGGQTQNTAPVLSLIAQFGGGKTHTLAALYHLVKQPEISGRHPDVQRLLSAVSLAKIPKAQVGFFRGERVGSQRRTRHTLDRPHAASGRARWCGSLGPKTNTTPPGTDTLQRVVHAAGGNVLSLFDEVLNFLSRHRDLAEGFYAFPRQYSEGHDRHKG